MRLVTRTRAEAMCMGRSMKRGLDVSKCLWRLAFPSLPRGKRRWVIATLSRSWVSPCFHGWLSCGIGAGRRVVVGLIPRSSSGALAAPETMCQCDEPSCVPSSSDWCSPRDACLSSLPLCSAAEIKGPGLIPLVSAEDIPPIPAPIHHLQPSRPRRPGCATARRAPARRSNRSPSFPPSHCSLSPGHPGPAPRLVPRTRDETGIASPM